MQKFVDHAHGVIRKLGMTPVVWQEMVADWNVKLGKCMFVQAWKGKTANAIAKAGYKVIDSNSDFCLRPPSSEMYCPNS